MDFDDGIPGYVHQYHPESDNFRIVSNLSQFHMLVTTGSDGFYTYYSNIGNNNDDCDDEEDETGTLIVHKVVEEKETIQSPNKTYLNGKSFLLTV